MGGGNEGTHCLNNYLLINFAAIIIIQELGPTAYVLTHFPSRNVL